jgi:FlaA1/EpsC-like NDP-sugar epimerase
MKRVLVLVGDLIIIYGSILLCFLVLGPRLFAYQENVRAFYIIAPLIGLLYLILMYSFDLYKFDYRKVSDVVASVFLLSLSLFVGIMAICFFVREGALAFPRQIIVSSAALYCLVLMAWRCFLWRRFRSHKGEQIVTVVGAEVKDLLASLKSKYKELYQVKYVCREDDPQLMQAVSESRTVILAADVSKEVQYQILLEADRHQAHVFFVPTYIDISVMTSAYDTTDDIPTFQLPHMGLSIEERFVKRGFDLLFATLGFSSFCLSVLLLRCW